MEDIAKLRKKWGSVSTEVKDGITVHYIRQFRSVFLDTLYKVDVYLPPDYDASTRSKLPLLFFNDGQDMAQVKLTKTLHRLFLEEKIPSIIVVAVHAGDRLHEYGVARQADYRNRGNKAGQYSRFVTQELLPFIRHHYPCHPHPSQAAFAGFSLGGLSALDIVWNHPQHFKMAGIFSGALWWRHCDFTKDNPDACRIVHEMIHADKYRPGLKFWLQTGTMDEKDDRNNNGIIDAIDDTLDLIKELKSKGYSDADIYYREVEGGIHHPYTWGQVLPEFLEWAFGK